MSTQAKEEKTIVVIDPSKVIKGSPIIIKENGTVVSTGTTKSVVFA